MKHLDPLYGEYEFDGVFEEIIQNPGMQRLTEVHQNGAAVLVNEDLDTTRFEHSLGVTILCREFGCGVREQLAALLHDISHTAFSHVADTVFDRRDETFHEDHHRRVIEDHGIDAILEDNGYDPDVILDESLYGVLERELPDLCADRLDYLLRDLVKADIMDRDDARGLLTGVRVIDNRLVCDDTETARELAEAFITLNKEVFYRPLHEAGEVALAQVLDEALDRGIIEQEDLFLTDMELLEQLREAGMAERLDAIGPEMSFEEGEGYQVTRKVRLVDPLVGGPDTRLSTIDPEAKAMLDEARERIPSEARYRVLL
jgi:HD superfamily phosphohydrolase